MSSAELLALAERCEAATDADRRLDAEIAAACRFFPANMGFVWKAGLRANVPEVGRVECHTNLGTGGPHYAAPKFTASLDAAMTLVPANSLWCTGDGIEGPFARLCIPVGIGYLGGEQDARYANTPALALCAAALRARATIPAASTRPHADGTRNAGIEAASGKGSL